MPAVNLLERDLAALVVVDVQDKMLAAIGSRRPASICGNIRRLVAAARILEIPVLYTEQYPRGLGPTVASLADCLKDARGPIQKTTCSCWRDDGFRTALQEADREHVLLVGLETHVCIQQTALDLLRVDFAPFVVADAVGSRNPEDYRIALERMLRAGVEISTTESVLFELVERCDHPRFKQILELVKESP
jgi:nicotinamidase-related amidase